jgi:hypothetical protein
MAGEIYQPVMTAPGFFVPGVPTWVVPQVNPYAYWQAEAAWNNQMIANAGLAQGMFNVQSMSASTNADANFMLGSAMMQLQALNDPSRYVGPTMRYNIRTARHGGTRVASGPRLNDLVSRSGDVLWPSFAPNTGYLADKRTAASQAIREVMGEVRRSGRASVDRLSSALNSLYGYAEPSIEELRKNDPANVQAFTNFAQDLDSGLRRLVGNREIDAPRIGNPGAGDAPKP